MINRPYTTDDIRRVPLEEHLRRNSLIYFGSRGPNAESIAISIAEGALVLGARQTLVKEEHGWWYVCADADWLRIPTVDGVDEHTIFETIWAFPEAGVNWHRSEALCRVFSDSAFSVCADELHRIKGSDPTDDEIRARAVTLGDWRRVVGFRFDRDA
jgi:hypothetical protein